MLDLPESCLCRLKSSGSPPMNNPVFSPIIVLPLEADALPGVGGGRMVVLRVNVVGQSKSVELREGKSKKRAFGEQKGTGHIGIKGWTT